MVWIKNYCVPVGIFIALAPVQVESFFDMGANSGKAKANSPPPSKIDRTKNPQWLDTLKYEGEPTFDVLQKTIEFANCRTYEDVAKYYDEEYVFRGPVIGPITGQEVARTQKGFQIMDGFPDFESRPFGFTVDPDNPFRCYFMERWEGTNTGDLQIGKTTLPASGNELQLPTHVMSLNWTPEGKLIYACLSAPLDRWEGTPNAKGAGAVIGLLAGAGFGQAQYPGDFVLRMSQRLVHAIGGFGRNWSVEEEIPDWWKSKARGADPNDL